MKNFPFYLIGFAIGFILGQIFFPIIFPRGLKQQEPNRTPEEIMLKRYSRCLETSQITDTPRCKIMLEDLTLFDGEISDIENKIKSVSETEIDSVSTKACLENGGVPLLKKSAWDGHTIFECQLK